MTTLESLNREFQKISNWENHFRYTLLKYIDEGLELLNGKAETPVKYKTKKEIKAAGVSFFGQFRLHLEVQDKQGFSFFLYVNKLYKKNGRLVVDGYNFSDEKWMKECLTDDNTENLGILAGFLNVVLNPENEN